MADKITSLKWWIKGRNIASVLLILVAVLVLLFPLRLCVSNLQLAGEIRAEYAQWVKTLPSLPDSENGMLLVLKGAQAFSEGLPDRFTSQMGFTMDNGFAAADLREYLALKKNQLGLVYEGLRYEKFQTPIDYSQRFGLGVSQARGLEAVAQLLAYKGDLAKFEGRKSDALRDYLEVLRLGRSLSSTPQTFYLESRVLLIGFVSLTKSLSESFIDKNDLAGTLESLTEIHSQHDYYPRMETCYYFFLIYAARRIDNLFEYVGRDPGFTAYERIGMSKFVHDYRRDVQICRKVLDLYCKIDPAKYYSLSVEGKDIQALMHKIWALSDKDATIFMSFALSMIDGTLRELAEVEALWRGAIALAAIRLFEARNGRLPENLDELDKLVPKELLIDPYSGKDLVYRLAGDDFYLYSVGYDGVDGKGTSDAPIFESALYQEGMSDVVFHAPAGGEKDK